MIAGKDCDGRSKDSTKRVWTALGLLLLSWVGRMDNLALAFLENGLAPIEVLSCRFYIMTISKWNETWTLNNEPYCPLY